ncbi:MAG: GNAT family N-acetyltransferase [Acetobacteraceae bacterium]
MTAETPVGLTAAAGFAELRLGNLGVRLARNSAEIDAVQALRYRVFYDEMHARPSRRALRNRRDQDDLDAVADHLVVIDYRLGSGPEGVVGTYRLIQREAAERAGRFYTAGEFDITRLVAFRGRLLELGRSCVDAAHRNRMAVQLLWRGIAAYVFEHQIDLMFGCASLPGTAPDAIAPELTYLYHYHLAPPAIRPVALASRRVEMRRLELDTLDRRWVLNRLPPLIKGYLRLGGFVGDGAVIDQDFNTTDVAMVVKTDLVTDKYYRHYERQLREALDDEPAS